MRYLVIVLALASLILVLAACKNVARGPIPLPGGGQPQGPEMTAYASVVIEPRAPIPALDRVLLSIQDISLNPGQKVLISAVATDFKGIPVENVLFQWQVTDLAAGTITPSGIFTAGATPGLYPDVLQVSAISATGTARTTANVVIASELVSTRFLESVIVYPSEVIVQPGELVGLRALGWDDRGRFVPNLQFQWSMADPDAGSVNQLGFFSAPDAPGRFREAIHVIITQDTPEGRIERRAFVTVTVRDIAQRGVLSHLLVLPNKVLLTPGQEVSFLVMASDGSAEPLKDVSFKWKIAEPVSGEMKEDGHFIAGAQEGEYAEAIQVVATQQTPQGTVQARASITVTVEPPKVTKVLAAALLVPRVVTLSPGQRFVFRSSGINVGGSPILANASWKVMDATAGSIDQLGVFTAGREPGKYPSAVRVELAQQAGDRMIIVQAYATVSIHGPLARAEINPSTVTIHAGQSFMMGVIGYDEKGLEVLPIPLRWSIEDPQAGSIDGAGLFTAGTNPGRYANAIRVTVVEVKRR